MWRHPFNKKGNRQFILFKRVTTPCPHPPHLALHGLLPVCPPATSTGLYFSVCRSSSDDGCPGCYTVDNITSSQPLNRREVSGGLGNTASCQPGPLGKEWQPSGESIMWEFIQYTTQSSGPLVVYHRRVNSEFLLWGGQSECLCWVVIWMTLSICQRRLWRFITVWHQNYGNWQ